MPRKSKTPKLTASQIEQILTPIPARIHTQITWIPVSDEMPPPEREVLVATLKYTFLGFHADGAWWTTSVFDSPEAVPDHTRITHWAHIQHPKDIPAVVPL